MSRPSTPLSAFVLLCVGVLTSARVQAELELPAVCSDSMVLQAGVPVRIQGRATAGSTVTVRISSQSVSAAAGADGSWSVQLAPLPASDQPLEMQISGDGETRTIRDILCGEVWLCSGQSNMAMTVSRAANADAEIRAANLPRLRMFLVESDHADQPQQQLRGRWIVCSPETAGRFSATAFFFGRRLHSELRVPVGLINSSVGGTSIESWTSLSAQEANAALKPRLDAWQELDQQFDAAAAAEQDRRALEAWMRRAEQARAAGKAAPKRPKASLQPRKDRNYPARLYNAMIHPLVGYTLRGAIWYQGENAANTSFASLYGEQLRTLITDWRSRWGQGDFPFVWVQLPGFRAPQREPSETSGWVLVREGMLKSLAVPNTGMAVTLDAGEANDIHPRDKQTVGQRLAQWALASVYQQPLIPMGPLFKRATVQGDKVVIEFDHAAGLQSRGTTVSGFAISGSDRQFVRADARIEGQTVIVSSAEVPQPAAVRYAWAANPVFSLYNSDGLPASPFRTDDWVDVPVAAK